MLCSLIRRVHWAQIHIMRSNMQSDVQFTLHTAHYTTNKRTQVHSRSSQLHFIVPSDLLIPLLCNMRNKCTIAQLLELRTSPLTVYETRPPHHTPDNKPTKMIFYVGCMHSHCQLKNTKINLEFTHFVLRFVISFFSFYVAWPQFLLKSKNHIHILLAWLLACLY